MSRLLCGALLLFAVSTMAQQTEPPLHPPMGTPPTFPEPGPHANPPMPPDTPAPEAPGTTMPREPDTTTPGSTPVGSVPEQNLPASQVQQQIQAGLNSELPSALVSASVDEREVVLNGTVNNEQERQAALRIAQSHAGNRQVVDKLKVRDRG